MPAMLMCLRKANYELLKKLNGWGFRFFSESNVGREVAFHGEHIDFVID
jgi:hypothetical protein